ncbi:MAG: hypothetical protein PHS79_03385 [Patescibacteria group bacterium]|nr:hypothetical protein [Patescibacteria group bacterium]
MLDTLVFALDGFEIPKNAILDARHSTCGCDRFKMPTGQSDGSYLPRVVFLRYPVRLTRKLKIELRVEFSVPKLLYGDSINEFVDTDFARLCDKLIDVLSSNFGLCVSSDQLANARLVRLDFCKNFLLPVTADLFFSHAKVFVFKTRCHNRDYKYAGNGSQLIWETKKTTLTLYDKSEEVRAQDDPEAMISLGRVMKDGSCAGLVRLEARFNGVKIKEILRHYGISEPITLKSVCNQDLARAILTDQLLEVVGMKSLSSVPALFVAQGGIKRRDAFTINGIFALARDFGMDQALSLHKQATSPNTHRRIVGLIKNAGPPQGGDLWGIIKSQLEKFEPIIKKSKKTICQKSIDL